MAPTPQLLDDVRREINRIHMADATLEDRAQALRHLRALSDDINRSVDHVMLEEHQRTQQGLREARETLEQFQEMLETLQNPPLVPAVFLRPMTLNGQTQAWVSVGGSERIVTALPTAGLADLQVGDEVLLSAAGDVLVAPSPLGPSRCGELATFDETMPDGRLLLREHETIFIVEPASTLAGSTMKAGDKVRFDKRTQLAHEIIPRDEGKRFLMDGIQDIPLSAVGGQCDALHTVTTALTAALVAPDIAGKYGIDGKNTILMYGPAGCGKTLMARVAAAELQRLSGKTVRFGVVKPGEFESPWVGETQQNIRQCFATLRESARDGFAVLFMDEIESVARTRGNLSGYHSDKFLAALLAELDGFTDRGNVAIIAATNRKELIDPALLSRISDIEILVGRPTREGARDIFGIHLPATLPFGTKGSAAKKMREAVLDAAVAGIYDADHGNAICELLFADGRRRTVTAADLISGRTIEQACREARRTACEREMRGGAPGMCVEDIELAVRNLRDRMDTLTPQNVGAYLTDLPADLPVVAVLPCREKETR
jgi:proteasome-associated ATPase